MKKLCTPLLIIFLCNFSCAATYYVSATGSDASGNGSVENPWKTLKYAVTKVSANQGHTLQLGSGTFIESGLIEIPAGVNIIGAGKTATILKAASTFYYYPASPGYSSSKFLISLSSSTSINGNQTLSNFTIDGDSKQLHGGIYVYNRNNVTIDAVKVQNTNFTGIWLWNVNDSNLKNTDISNCAWGSSSYCSGALNLGNLARVDIDHLTVDEGRGYGVKAIGPSGNNNFTNVKIHDSRISVAPTGLWNGGSAPNIAIELWSVNLVGNEIYNTYVDNTISLVNSNGLPATGNQTIRVHHNTIDMATRANGAGYGIELTVHDAEVDHNYFIKGTNGIANWDKAMQNWSIHHNTFYNLQGQYPGEVVRSQANGLHQVKLYNNTIEFASAKTMNVVGMYGGASDNITIQNNLFINNNTGYSYYTNSLVHMENGATTSTLIIKNNLFDKLSIGSLSGATYQNNLSGDPQIVKTGNRPDAYYTPMAGSPLIHAGLNMELSLLGSTPDIGAIEYTPPNASPQVNITNPKSDVMFTAGTSLVISANASDSDGTISKVEFYNGTILLGEDLTSPYTVAWNNVQEGSYLLTAKTTDNAGASTISSTVSITVSSANTPPVVSITSPSNNSAFTTGASITINATASDGNGTVSLVEFYNGNILLGQDATSPYILTWNNVQIGGYSLTAKATDNAGATTSSPGVSIVVAAPPNMPPIVSLTSPSMNATFATGNSVTLAAMASDSDGSISKVEFYNGTTLLGQDLTSPYGLTWTAITGSHAITAKVTDNLGATVTSPSVTVTVNSSIVKLGFDSSDAALSGLMTTGYDILAQRGTYFYIPAGSGKNYAIPPPAAAVFNFPVPLTDKYVVWVKVKSLGATNKGFYVYNGAGKWFTWLPGFQTTWTWVKITEGSTSTLFSFTLGTNQFKMAWYDENVAVDQILITNDGSFIPPADIATVSATTSSTLYIYPNPVVTREFTIAFNSSVVQQAQLSMFSMGMVLVKQTIVNLQAGPNEIIVGTEGVYNGTYIVALVPAQTPKLTTQIILNK
jgi:hypothetical protein